ncbi:MAG TPA: RodZ domain-containing protein [Vicinamibacterales bacterium]|jgi:cytoskeletal protein RodZ
MPAERSGDFGTRLREARERKGISLRQVAAKTKISLPLLEALERNDVARLPGGIFSRAFVRSYAVEIGLDPEDTIQQFISQFPQGSVTAGHSRTDAVEDTELFESDRQVASSVLWIAFVSITFIGGAIYLVKNHRPTEEAQVSAPASSPVPQASSEPSASPLPENVASAQNSAPPAQTTAAPPAAAASTTKPAATPTPTAATATAGERGTEAPPAGDTVAVVLSARRPVWISATADGKKILGRLLQSGEEEKVDVSRELSLTAGDAAALRMTLNGSDARVLGKAGEVVTVRVTPANFKDYLVSR